MRRTAISTRSFALFFATASLLACAPRVVRPAGPRGPVVAGDHLAVEVVGLRNDTGTVRVAVYATAAGFPTDRSAVVSRCEARIDHGVARCDAPASRGAGEYAVAILHDEDNDGEPMMNLVGAPLEGIGFSNDARPMLAPPSWEAARVNFTGGTLPVRITAQY